MTATLTSSVNPDPSYNPLETPSVGSADSYIEWDPRNDPWIKQAEIEIPEDLPCPQGWRMLILPWKPPEMVGSVHIPDNVADVNADVVMVGMVMGMGLDAYKGTDAAGNPRFVAPWCEEGDWVMFAKWAGSRIQIENTRFRLLNDDEIFAVVEDPSKILRA